jgi:Undecaprenyl-phosphate galactose phosphotransferase WbaP
MLKSATLFLGFGFSFLPNFTPFLAILVFFTQRHSLQRRDVIWFGASVLLALPLALAGDVAPAVRDLAQLVGAWLLFRAFSVLRRSAEPKLETTLLGIGLLAGLAAVIGAGAMQIESVRSSANLSQVLVWSSYPALFGHTVLTLGVLIAATVPRGILRAAALILSAIGILLSGSREAAIAWLVVVVILQLFVPLRTLRGRLVEAGFLVAMLLLTVGIGSQYGFARLGFLLDVAPGRQSSNLLHGTELEHGDWWFTRGVEVESSQVAIAGQELTAYRVIKTQPEQWRRLQQVAELEEGQAYTLSVWIGNTSDGARPGIQGWGETTGGGGFVLSTVLEGEHWNAGTSGAGKVLDSRVTDSGNGWRRAWVTFRYDGTEPLTWWVGVTPDQRPVAGTWAKFAGFQLEASEILGEYVPGSATQGLGIAAARSPYWRAAVQAFLDRPLLGWGALPFPDYYLERFGSLGRFYEVPDHTHSLPLQVLYERGLVGFSGLILLLGALARPALRMRDVPMIAALLAVGIANLFDYSLFHAGVMYPLAAIAGWRSAGRQEADRASMQAARQATVRLVLAASDLVAVTLAVLAAAALRMLLGMETSWLTQLEQLPSVALYALMLWPAAAWREGLYPGYGLTAPQELGKQVQAGVFAGLLLAVLSLFLPLGDVVPRSLLLATILLSLFIAPVGRALAKRLLLSFGLWGRPLVVLGAGETGRRVVRALCRSPLDGLQPVALFDDDPALPGSTVGGLPVVGTLEDAGAFAKGRGIDHAIVAIRTLSSQTATSLINTQGRSFRHMQFIPDLAGLPAEEVYASSLDGMLALEVRNGLYSRRNRLFKRAIDLAGTAVVGLIAAPVLLAIYLWVRFDSRGPGFYRSRRIGENGGQFHCLKFRTMYVDADERLAEIMANDESVRIEYLRYHKLERDPRVTRVGRLLRRFSLDELPQLYNVLVGEMSLVGPRPYMVREQNDMGRYSETILRAKPGITGYWQVTGRSNVTFQDRLEMESHYVRNWSIWWDIICLVKSFGAVLRRDGAV